MPQPSFVRRTLGASALSLLLPPAFAFADDPPESSESGFSEVIAQVAEKAADAAQKAAEQKLEEGHRAATEAAAVAAKHAEEAADNLEEQAAEAARRVIYKARKSNRFYKVESGYQLGLHVTPMPSVLSSQLKLDGKGVLVDSVEAEGPAARAGIQAHDVLMAVGETAIANAKELSQAVQASDGKEVAVKLIRGGETQTVKLTPTKRMATTSIAADIKLPTDELNAAENALEANIRDKLKSAGLDVRLQLIRPGHMLPLGAAFVTQARIPDDLTLVIEKTGEQPADIKVRRGEESWSAKEGDLSALPAQVRPYVERMLGHGPMPFKIAVPPRPPVSSIDFADGKTLHGESIPIIVGPGGTQQTRERHRGSLERQIEQLDDNLESMMEQMKELRRELGEDEKRDPKR